MKKGPRHDATAPKPTPNPRSLMKILPEGEPRRNGEMNLEERGGTGTRHQASPAPHTTHSPKAKMQGVC